MNTKRFLLQTITIKQVGDLMREATQVGDEKTVADCIRTVEWIDAGRKTRSKAARRVLRILNQARRQANEALNAEAAE